MFALFHKLLHVVPGKKQETKADEAGEKYLPKWPFIKG